MADITAGMVKELREMTGAGMMDCKKALATTEGDMDKAVEFLREKGLAAATKKAGRIAAEGVVKTLLSDDHNAVVVEVNSETDFVAKNAEFNEFVDAVAAQAMNSNAADMDAFMQETWAADPSLTVEQALSSKVARIGEKLSIRRFEKVTGADLVVSYIHGDGKIGVLVEAATDVVNDDIKEALKNVAMQIAALHPQYVCDSEVPEEFKEHEIEIIKAQIANDPKAAGKPEKVIEGMIQGKLNKELKEICLNDQVYVKAEDGKQSVSAYLAQVGKANNAKLSVKKFVRFERGEGMEKKQENFAEEVAKQMAGN